MKQLLFVLKNRNIHFDITRKSIASIFLVAVFFLSCKQNNVEQINQFIHPEGAPDVVANGFELMYSDSGIVRFRLTTPNLQLYNDEQPPYKEFPEGFKIEKYNSQMQITSSVTADYGKQFPKKDLWEAKQNVVAVTEAGDSLFTEHLFWNDKEDRIYTDQFVKIVRTDGVFLGTGLESDTQMKRWEILNPGGSKVYIDTEDE